MQIPVDHDHWIKARAPQAPTSSVTPISQRLTGLSSMAINTGPFSPDPSTVNTTAQAPHDNSKSVRRIIEYFFLILAVFVASVAIFRRLFYLRKRQHHQGRLHSHRPFPRTTDPPRVDMRGYPLLDGYFPPLPLPTASTNARRTRATDIDLDGRRFTSPGTEVDHDGSLRDKDVLPKYELLGGPPKYADLELQRVLFTGTVTPSPPVIPNTPGGC